MPSREQREQDYRIQRVIAMLDKEPEKNLAMMTAFLPGRDDCTLTIAIRGKAAFEMSIDRDQADPWNLLTLIDKFGVILPDEENEPWRPRGPFPAGHADS